MALAGEPINERSARSVLAHRPSRTRILDLLDHAALPLLGAAIFCYCTGIFLASQWEMYALRFGYDPVVYEQPIWNTLHRHVMEQSTYSYTHLAFGWDLLLFNFVLLPFYALHPATVTLLLLQTIAAGAGAVAVYLIARDALPGRRSVALLFALLYLSYLPMQNVNLYEVSPRLFAMTFFLFAFWCMTRNFGIAFWACIALAIINRSDAALVVAGIGIYGLLTRRRVAFSWLPLIIGGGYWVLAVFIVIPAFARGAQFSYLQNYAWLGGNVSAIARTLVMHPVFVLRQVLAPDRWIYVVSLLFALGFLPLLSPRLLIPALPSFLINIFAGPEFRYQRDIFHQYPAFIIPWLFVAAIAATASVANGSCSLLRLLPPILAWVRSHSPARVATALIVAMLCLSIAQQAYTRPSKTLWFVTHKEDASRVTALETLLPLIPNDAPLAVTNVAATRVPMRRYLYFFPGDRYYDPRNIDRAVYLLGDRRGSRGDEGRQVDALMSTGQWELVRQVGDFELLHRIASPPAA